MFAFLLAVGPFCIIHKTSVVSCVSDLYESGLMQIFPVYLNIISHVNPHEQEIRLQGIFPVKTVLSKLYTNRILPEVIKRLCIDR